MDNPWTLGANCLDGLEYVHLYCGPLTYVIIILSGRTVQCMSFRL